MGRQREALLPRAASPLHGPTTSAYDQRASATVARSRLESVNVAAGCEAVAQQREALGSLYAFDLPHLAAELIVERECVARSRRDVLERDDGGGSHRVGRDRDRCVRCSPAASANRLR